MSKLILFALLFYLIYKMLGSGQKQRPSASPGPETRQGAGRTIFAGELVEDPQCGVYVSKEEAVQDGKGRFFCSPACRDAYAQRSG
jgi:hypothetical protein